MVKHRVLTASAAVIAVPGINFVIAAAEDTTKAATEARDIAAGLTKAGELFSSGRASFSFANDIVLWTGFE